MKKKIRTQQHCNNHNTTLFFCSYEIQGYCIFSHIGVELIFMVYYYFTAFVRVKLFLSAQVNPNV